MNCLNNIQLISTNIILVVSESHVKLSDAIVPGIFGILFLVASYYNFRKYIASKKNNDNTNNRKFAKPNKNRISGIIVPGLMGLALIILSVYLIVYKPVTAPKNKVQQIQEIFNPI